MTARAGVRWCADTFGGRVYTWRHWTFVGVVRLVDKKTMRGNS